MWRRLLTGQRAADELLDGRAYVSAAAMLLAYGRRIAFHYLWKWSWAILLAAGAAGAAVWAAVTYAPTGAERVAAVLASAAGFLGVSWVGARATLGRALQQAESALWDAEVTAAIGKAATMTPQKLTRRSRLATSAAQGRRDDDVGLEPDDDPERRGEPLEAGAH
jgi:hypothetical protein